MTKKLFICLLILSVHCLTGQQPRGVRLYVNGGVIVNDSYSHFEKWDQSYPVKYKVLPPLKAGLQTGITALLGRSRRTNVILGLSCTLTRAAYGESHQHEFLADPLFVTITEDMIRDRTYIYLNLEMGARFMFFRRRLVLQPLLIGHISQLFIEHGQGTRTTHHHFGPSNVPASHLITTESIGANRRGKALSFFSLRLTAAYPFRLNGRESEVFAYFDKAWYVRYTAGAVGLSIKIL